MKEIIQKMLMIFLIIVLLFVMYSKYIAKSPTISFFGYQFLIVLTGSMEPEIKTNSFIIIKENNNYLVR